MSESDWQQTPGVRGDEVFRRRLEMLDVTRDILRNLDFESVAQRIVEAVVQVTDFSVATLTLRDDSECRRVAASGIESPRIGMTTPFESWAVLLRDEWRQGGQSYLIPPEAPALWADVPDIPKTEEPDAWSAEHGLVIPLRDSSDEIVGFLSVDQPQSGRLPDHTTIEALELFARQAQIAFVNARLYDLTRRQADTMAQLFEVAKTMANSMDFAQVVPVIVEALRQRFDPYVSVLVRRHGDVLDVTRADRDVAGIHEHVTGLSGVLVDVLARIEAGERLVRIDDLDDWPELRDRLTAGTRSILIAGSCDSSELCLALVVSSDKVRAFDAEAEAFLAGVLDCTVVALRNSELYQEVRFAADRDPLTGLHNRRVFWVTVRDTIAAASETSPLACALIDIDNFKSVNDALGHEAGDRALQHVAGRLEANVRETDSVFRIGGEEFVLLMPNTDNDGAKRVLTRVSSAIKTSRLELPPLTISAGVALAPFDATSADRLVNAADAALYEAKRLGKDRTEAASRNHRRTSQPANGSRE